MSSRATLLGIGSGGGGENGVVGSAESKMVGKMHRSASCVSGSLRTSSTAPSPSPAPMEESASVSQMTQDDLRNKILHGMSSGRRNRKKKKIEEILHVMSYLGEEWDERHPLRP